MTRSEKNSTAGLGDFKTSWLLFAMTLCATVGAVIYFLSMSLFQSPQLDESYFWWMVRVQANAPMSHFPYYFSAVSDWGLVPLRTLGLILFAIGAGVLGGGIYAVWKEKLKLFWGDFLALILIIFCGYVIVRPTDTLFPSYYLLNFCFGEVAMGLFLISFATQVPQWIRNVALLFCGIAAAQPLFYYLPAFVIPFLMLFILWRMKQPRAILLLLAGVCLGIVAYFILCQSPGNFIDDYLHATQDALNEATPRAVNKASPYTITGRLLWLGHTCVSYFLYVFVWAFFLFLITEIRVGWKTILVSLVILIGLAVFDLRVLEVNIHGTIHFMPINIILAWQLLCALKRKILKGADAYLVALLFLLPYIFSSGGAATMETYIGIYAFYAFGLSYILAQKMRSPLQLYFLAFVLLFGCFYGYVKKDRIVFQSKEVLSNMTQSLSSVADTSAKTSPRILNRIQRVKTYSEGYEYLAGDCSCWTFNALLNKRPLSDSLFYYGEYMDIAALAKQHNLNANSIVFLELPKRLHWDEARINSVKLALGADSWERIPIDEEFNIIRFSNK